jgi:DNA-binding SARP family transcriptional activator
VAAEQRGHGELEPQIPRPNPRHPRTAQTRFDTTQAPPPKEPPAEQAGSPLTAQAPQTPSGASPQDPNAPRAPLGQLPPLVCPATAPGYGAPPPAQAAPHAPPAFAPARTTGARTQPYPVAQPDPPQAAGTGAGADLGHPPGLALQPPPGSDDAQLSARTANEPTAAAEDRAMPVSTGMPQPQDEGEATLDQDTPPQVRPVAGMTCAVDLDQPQADQDEPAGPNAEAAPGRAPEVRVLGTVELAVPAGPGQPATVRGGKLAELAAFLLLQPGQPDEDIAKALGEAAPWAGKTLNARVAELRKRLGTDAEGELYLPRKAGYRLGGVRCDWQRFAALADHGLACPGPPVAELEAALALVRGRPFAGKAYRWAQPLRQQMIDRIVQVAHAVACQRLSTQDYDAARQAIGVGLVAEPGAQLLYRDWIKAEDRSGNRPGVMAVIEQLRQVTAEHDRPLEAESAQAIAAVCKA